MTGKSSFLTKKPIPSATGIIIIRHISRHAYRKSIVYGEKSARNTLGVHMVLAIRKQVKMKPGIKKHFGAHTFSPMTPEINNNACISQ